MLDELGVGDAVRSLAPGADVIRLTKDGAVIDVRLPDGVTERCPRRQRLDGLLQDAAIAAGAAVKELCQVTEVTFKDGRARGVRLMQNGGSEVIDAVLVVGADGRQSTVARSVGAEEYLGYDAPRARYWTYFEEPALWRDKDAYPFGMTVARRGRTIRTLFQTDHGQLLLGSLPTMAEVESSWRHDPEGCLVADLKQDPELGPLLEAAGKPVEKVRATYRERYFFRRGAGPGWLLVGDAGHHKDFVIGNGITEALLQARSAAEAILEGSDLALAKWWRQRDVEAMPMFFMSQDEGSPEPFRELQGVVMRHVAQREDLRRRLFQVVNRELPAHKVFSAPQILGWPRALPSKVVSASCVTS